MKEIVEELLRGTVAPMLLSAASVTGMLLVREVLKRIRDDRLREVLLMLVEAAEQVYGPGQGSAKRRYVRERLRAQGLGHVPREAVEAAVYELHNR